MSQYIIDKLTSFDPNEVVGQLWGSYSPWRSQGPKFKVHTEESYARQACRLNDGSLYFLAGGDWVLWEIWVSKQEVYR